MKQFVITLSLIFLISLSAPMIAQEKQQTIEKKVMIIKTTDQDSDKNVWISDEGKRIDIESDDLMFIGSDDDEGDKDISVNVSKSIKDGQDVREIEITIKEDGNTKVIEWEDDGVTIPADIQAMLEKEGIDLQMFSGDEKMTITVDAIEGKSSEQEKTVNVNVEANDNDGELTRDIEITIEGDGEKQVMKWTDDGETPTEIQEQLDALGIDINVIEGGEHGEDVQVIIEKILGEEDIDLNNTDIEKRIYKIDLQEDEDVSEDVRQELKELGIDIDVLIQEAKDKKTGDEPVKMKKRIMIKSTDADHEDGTTDVRIIRLKDGEVLTDDIKQILDKEGIDLNELHEDQIKGSHSTKSLYRIKVKTDDGDEKVMDWDGEGEMPAEIKELIEKLDKEGHGLHLDHKHIKSNKAQLGVMIEDHDQGIYVSEVIKDSAASRIGMTAGDVITHVDGLQVFDSQSLLTAMQAKKPGDQAKFSYLRNGVVYNASATLQSQSGNEEAKSTKTVKVTVEKCDTNKMTGDESIDVLFQSLNKQEGDSELEDDMETLLMLLLPEQKREAELEALTETDKRVDSATIQVNPQTETETRVLPIENNKQLKLDNFKAYPNPTSGFVNISFEGKALPLTIQISDITGQTVFKETLNSFTGHFNKNIDLSEAPTGQFVLHVIQGQNVFTETIVVQ